MKPMRHHMTKVTKILKFSRFSVRDLIVTAVLHAQGRIQELNPLMKPLIEQSEWLFVLVKGMTLVAAAIGLIWYGRQNREFVRKACILGSFAYLMVFTLWFVKGA